MGRFCYKMECGLSGEKGPVEGFVRIGGDVKRDCASSSGYVGLVTEVRD